MTHYELMKKHYDYEQIRKDLNERTDNIIDWSLRAAFVLLCLFIYFIN